MEEHKIFGTNINIINQQQLKEIVKIILNNS